MIRAISMKDSIGQEIKKMFLEGKENEFRKEPVNQNQFRKIILDVEKYDREFSNKLAWWRSSWGLSALRGNGVAAQAVGINLNDLEQFEKYRREADRLADEIKDEVIDKWVI